MEAATKNALIIGPGRAFGSQLVQKFIDNGFHVTGVHKSELGAFNTKRRLTLGLTSNVDRYNAIIGSVRRDGITAALQAATKRMPLDCIIYNARSSHRAPELHLSETALADDLEVGAIGALNTLQCAPQYMHADKPTSIIFTNGNYASDPSSKHVGLSVAKAAARALFFAALPIFENSNVRLKLLDINGKVGHGAVMITPDRVADTFLFAHENKVKGKVLHAVTLLAR